MPYATDRDIVRALAAQAAELAASPVMDEKRRLWSALNQLRPERPMVNLDQVCWSEMNVGDELTLRCENPDLRWHEERLRQIIYRFKHMPVDHVADDYIPVSPAINGANFGIGIKETLAVTDPNSEVVSHSYENQIRCMADIEKVKMPVVTHDEKETARRLEIAHDAFDGVMPVRLYGHDPYISVWDPISMWMGVENTLYAMIDEPEMMHALADRVVAGYMTMLDQIEELGLLVSRQSWIHCTGAWTDELPPAGFEPDKPRTTDIWGFGLAQMLSTCSPEMFDEFEVEHCLPLLERFGIMYYGCCDPLDRKIAQVRRIRNVRKISMSPWTDEANGAEQIGSDYVFSRKPNPAILAMTNFDESLARAELVRTKELCRANNCPLEFIMKDISTVKGDPRRLWRWAQIAMEVAEEN